MSTIERLAELAKKATQGEWVMATLGDGPECESIATKDKQLLTTVVYEGRTPFGAIYSDADAEYIAACNPAAIAQAYAEHKALVAERDALRQALRSISDCDFCVGSEIAREALALGTQEKPNAAD